MMLKLPGYQENMPSGNTCSTLCYTILSLILNTLMKTGLLASYQMLLSKIEFVSLLTFISHFIFKSVFLYLH